MVLVLSSPNGVVGSRVDLRTPDGGSQPAVMADVPLTPVAAPPDGRRISWEEDFDMVGGGTIPTTQAVIPLGGLTNWRGVSTGATGTILPVPVMAEAGHPGLCRLTTNGAAVNRAIHLFRGGNIVGQGFTFANQFQQCEFIARLNDVAAVACVLGMTNNLRGAQTSQIALLFNSSVSANWQFACSKAGPTTTVDTGIPPDPGVFHRFTIAQTVLGTATLAIDGVQVALINDANVPTTEILDYAFGLETLAVAAKTLDIDWCSYFSQDLGARSP